MEEMQRARYEEQVKRFHAQSEGAMFPKSPCVYQLRSSLNPVLLDFYWHFITQESLITSLSMRNKFNLQLCSFWKVRVDETGKFNPLIIWLVLLVTSLHPWVLFKSHLINTSKGNLVTVSLKKFQFIHASLDIWSYLMLLPPKVFESE